MERRLVLAPHCDKSCVLLSEFGVQILEIAIEEHGISLLCIRVDLFTIALFLSTNFLLLILGDGFLEVEPNVLGSSLARLSSQKKLVLDSLSVHILDQVRKHNEIHWYLLLLLNSIKTVNPCKNGLVFRVLDMLNIFLEDVEEDLLLLH